MEAQAEQPTPSGWRADSHVDHWKRQYGSVFEVETTDDEGAPLLFYFKKLDKATLSAVAKVGADDPMRGVEVMFHSLLLNNEMAKWADDVDVFTAVAEKLGEMRQARRAELKKR